MPAVQVQYISRITSKLFQFSFELVSKKKMLTDSFLQFLLERKRYAWFLTYHYKIYLWPFQLDFQIVTHTEKTFIISRCEKALVIILVADSSFDEMIAVDFLHTFVLIIGKYLRIVVSFPPISWVSSYLFELNHSFYFADR